jgi:hypothetical protein
MSAPVWTIDPTAEATGTELVITSDPYYLLDQSCPMPDTQPAYSTSQSMEGERLAGLHYANRKISLTLRVVGASDSALEAAVSDLQEKVGKLNRDALVGGTGFGGTLKYTSPAGTSCVFDVCHARVLTEMGQPYVKRSRSTVMVEFECAPFGRGDEVLATEGTEATLPVLSLTVPAVAGDVPALGRLVVDEDDADSQSWLVWGLRSKSYSSASTAGLFYQAEALTPQGGGAATSTAASGYSGTGSILADDLSTSFESVLSSQASGGGAHWTHVGGYRVFARVQADTSNTGTVSVALEWAVGDFRRPSRNATVELDAAWEGSWRIADLGIVNVPSESRWEARVLAKSTVLNDNVHVDWLMLVPVDEGSGEATAGASTATTTGYTARDNFESGTYSGDLASDTLPTGGTWGTTASPYEATDFAVVNPVLQRTATSDTSTDIRYGRIMYPSGTASMTNTAVQVSFLEATYTAGQGVTARVVDKDNLLVAYTYPGGIRVRKVVAGTVTSLYEREWTGASGGWYAMRLSVTAGGAWTLHTLDVHQTTHIMTGEFEPSLIASGTDSALATGGALASGYCGIVDWHTSATAETRQYDQFLAWAPVLDAAIFASQSARITHNTAEREDSGGTFWTPQSRYEGDYLTVPASGKESRTTQFIVKASRNDPATGADAGIDDISAALYVKARYLQLPS